ncbi:MAG: hypothetical protein ABI416_17125 [Ginsengibacter sp.]
MKNYLSISVNVFVMGFLGFLCSGCLKDTCSHTRTYSWFEPLYKTSAEVSANIKSNPPKEIQNPGKLYISNGYIFLNEIEKGIHVIDNRNPSSPKNVAFIEIPGNVDLAVKENILYADLYSDLVTLDITDPLNVVKKDIMDAVFPDRYYGGIYLTASGDNIVFDWIEHDTTVTENCDGGQSFLVPGVMYSDFMSASGIGQIRNSTAGKGGSMARFALVNNYLYAVGSSDLSAINITNGSQPVFSNKVLVDWHVETIYPFKDKLFVGSNNGMFIYDVSASPENPVKVGEFTHARACDPVIADDNFAYVTLHSGTICLGYNNELDVVKLNGLADASLAKTYNLTSPQGLSKDGNLLFICDGTDGLKVYNANDVMNLQLIKQFPDFESYDVIAYNRTAIVVAKDGLYQYDYSDPNNIHLVSKLGILK